MVSLSNHERNENRPPFDRLRTSGSLLVPAGSLSEKG